jgi:hypothetical protein
VCDISVSNLSACDRVNYFDIKGTHATPIGQIGASVNLGDTLIGDLAAHTAFHGAGKELDTLTGIEVITGSNFNDFLVGSAGDNLIFGVAFDGTNTIVECELNNDAIRRPISASLLRASLCSQPSIFWFERLEFGNKKAGRVAAPGFIVN